MLRNIYHIIRHEILLEFRQKFAIGGILLFLFSSVFVVDKVFVNIQVFTWNAIFWILFLFIAINSLLKSYSMFEQNRFMYYFSLYNPIELAIAKIIYNSSLLFLLGLLLFATLSVLTVQPVRAFDTFFSGLFLASIGIGSSVSFISLISSKGQNSHILITILSMPVLLPTLLIMVKITAVSVGIIEDSSLRTDFLILLGIDMLSVGLSLILFPYLWRN